MPFYSHYSDQQLLSFLKQGDRLAFSEIYDRTWAQLYKTAYKRLKDKEVCKDIIHDVFADLWNKSSTKEITDLIPYLHTAVRYKIYSWLGKGNNTAHFIEPYESMALSPLTAESWFEERDLQRLIALWMDTLPEKRKVIFKLKYQDDLSTRDISEQLNLSQKTVQNQLLTSFNGLKAYLSHYLLLILILMYS
ncbi:MAG: sigma-70 family RNA polymerase sigma factor [Mucilaginibacter sp.]|uniref:RNA polymerase sigma factor n=1 Tax=Mucilaginibacter sp. TaxID=1882438 RepID=UPI0031AC09AB